MYICTSELPQIPLIGYLIVTFMLSHLFILKFYVIQGLMDNKNQISKKYYKKPNFFQKIYNFHMKILKVY